MHGLTRRTARPLLPARPDQTKVVPYHYPGDLLALFLPNLDVVRLRHGLCVPLWIIRSDRLRLRQGDSPREEIPIQ